MFVRNKIAGINADIVTEDINEISKTSLSPSISFPEVSENQLVHSIRINVCYIEGICVFLNKRLNSLWMLF